MIVTKLMGGLGNQMFQYAAGRALAVRHNESLFYDTTFLDAGSDGVYTKRHLELTQLNIKASPCNKEVKELFVKEESVFKRIFSGRNSQYHIFTDNQHGFNKKYSDLGKDVYLDGYWQSEKYFASIRDILVEEFLPVFTFNDLQQKYLDKIRNSESVGLHVRRGDYVTLKSATDFHGLCSIEYYNDAVKKMNNHVSDPAYFVFSDDLEWCEQNLGHLHNVIFVDSKSEYSATDMLLMSKCKHNIIANSSYSWWAAWLNRNDGKKVIAPAKWFVQMHNPDLVPANFIQL